MTQMIQDIRLLENGAIDVSYYQWQSRVLRSRAMNKFFKGLGPVTRPLIAFGAMASVLFAVAI